MSTSCTPQERTFAREYIRTFSVTKAFKACGISKTTAYKYLAKECVQAFIAEEMERRSSRTQLDMDRIIKELAIISQSDITDYFDNAGGRLLTFKDLSSLPPEQTRCIQAIKEHMDLQGNLTFEIKLYDKLKAIRIVADSLTNMINQMRDYIDTHNQAAQIKIGGDKSNGNVKLLGVPGKVPTLAEWEKQMQELQGNMKDANVVDAEYTTIAQSNTGPGRESKRGGLDAADDDIWRDDIDEISDDDIYEED